MLLLLLLLLQIGFTPLHLSIEHKNDSMVALLLKLGADPDIPNKVCAHACVCAGCITDVLQS